MFGHTGLGMLICRIADVGPSDIYAATGILIRHSVDLAVQGWRQLASARKDASRTRYRSLACHMGLPTLSPPAEGPQRGSNQGGDPVADELDTRVRLTARGEACSGTGDGSSA